MDSGSRELWTMLASARTIHRQNSPRGRKDSAPGISLPTTHPLPGGRPPSVPRGLSDHFFRLS